MALEEVGVKLLAEDANKFDKEMRESRAAFDSFVSAIEAGARGIDGGMGKAEGAIDNFTSSSKSNFSAMDAASEIVIGALRRIGEMAVNALVSAGQAVIQFGSDSLNVAGDFEATLNRFKAVTGESLAAAGMDVQDFSDLFLEMGAKTQYSAQEAAEAAVALAKGGIEPAAIAAGGLEAALTLAAAGELGLAASAEILAKQLGVWSDKGVTAIEITNLLAQAANASTVDVDELANGLANVQGRAAGMGVEYNELVQTMALIAPNFESASTAGTSLNNFFARLIPATDKAENAMQDLGLATADGQSLFFDATGSFIGMEASIGLLSAATAGLSEEERAAAFNTIFGNDAMGAAIALSEANASGYNEMGAAMNAAGGAAEQATARNQGYNFALEEMKGSMETLQIVLGTALLPALTEFIQGHITPGINEIMKFVGAILESPEPLGKFAYLVRDSLPWFKEFMEIIRANDPIAKLIEKIDEVIPGFANFVSVTEDFANRIIEFATTFSTKFAPEIALAQNIIETAMTAIQNIVDAVTGAIGEAWTEFTKDFADNDFGKLITALGTLWESIQPVILLVLQILGVAILGFLGAITGMISGVLAAADYFVQMLTGIALSISVIVQGYVDIFGGAAEVIRGILNGNAKEIIDGFWRMGEGIVEIFAGAFGLIFSVIVGGAATILSFVGGLIGGITSFFTDLYNDLVGHSIIPDMVNGILDWFNDLAVRGLVFITSLVDDIKALFTDTDWMALGKGIVDGIINGITSLAGNLATAAKDAASAAYTAVTDFLGMESPSKLFMEVGEMTMLGYIDGIRAEEEAAAKQLEDVFAQLTLDAQSTQAGAVSPISSPVSNVTNVYNDNSTHAGENYNMNVRTPESVGTVGNTIRSLQSISRVRGGG